MKARWTRSSHCDSGSGCVEVLVDDGLILVRDSADEDVVLGLSKDAWTNLLESLR